MHTLCNTVHSLCITRWLLWVRLCFYCVYELFLCLGYFIWNLNTAVLEYACTFETAITPTFLCLRALLPTRFLKRQSFFLWRGLECNAKDEYFSDRWCSLLYFWEIFRAECVTMAGLNSNPSWCGNIALSFASTSFSMRLVQRSCVASVQLYKRDSTTFSVVRTCWRAFWAETEH